MNKENTKKLFKDFPKLYRQRSLPPTQSLMIFGFECGDGWFNLLYDLSKKLSELSDEIEACQVKEKFGSLRFYISSVPEDVGDEAYDIIQEAEDFSVEVCELCGESGRMTGISWLKTLCKKCEEERSRL